MGPLSKIVAVCLSAVVLAGGVVLSAAARGGHSGGDSGSHQYGAKPACKQHEGGHARSAERSRYRCPRGGR